MVVRKGERERKGGGEADKHYREVRDEHEKEAIRGADRLAAINNVSTMSLEGGI